MYDNDGRTIKETDALSRVTTYEYDGVDNRTLKWDARDTRCTMTYDAANRLTKEDYSNPDAAVIDYANTFGYDDTNNITQLTDPSGTISSAFSGRDNKLWENNRDNKRVTYTYDCVENRDTMRDSDGGRFTYTYDVKNRLRTTTNPKNEVTTCSYDLADRETRRDLANSTFMVRDYDQDGRIDVLTNEKVAGGLISKFTYTYDCADNRQDAEELDGTLVTWTYDQKYQMLSEHRDNIDPWSSYRNTYTYDPTGNRLTKDASVPSVTLTTYVYDVCNELTTETTGTAVTTYTYDECGNRVKKDVPSGGTDTFYDYDAQNRVIEVNPGSPVTFTYNPANQRIEKDATGGMTKYVYDFKKLLQETDWSDTTTALYTSTLRDEYGDLVSQFREDNSGFFQSDAIGSTSEITDAAAAVQNQYKYDGFGTAVLQDESYPTNYTWIGMQGYYKDLELDYYFPGQRMYDPSTGQFTRQDPIGLEGGDVNQYRYVANNPVNATDPSGLQEPDEQPGKVYVPGTGIIPDNRPLTADELLRLVMESSRPDTGEIPADLQEYYDQIEAEVAAEIAAERAEQAARAERRIAAQQAAAAKLERQRKKQEAFDAKKPVSIQSILDKVDFKRIVKESSGKYDSAGELLDAGGSYYKGLFFGFVSGFMDYIDFALAGFKMAAEVVKEASPLERAIFRIMPSLIFAKKAAEVGIAAGKWAAKNITPENIKRTRKAFGLMYYGLQELERNSRGLSTTEILDKLASRFGTESAAKAFAIEPDPEDLQKFMKMVEKVAPVMIEKAMEMADDEGPETAGYISGMVVYEVLEGLAVGAVTVGAGAVALKTAKLPKIMSKLAAKLGGNVAKLKKFERLFELMLDLFKKGDNLDPKALDEFAKAIKNIDKAEDATTAAKANVPPRADAPSNLADDAFRAASRRKQEAERLISRHPIDMNNAPVSSATTSLGFKRNGPWFWRQLRGQKPEMFSPTNVRRIKQGKSPLVDQQWLRHNPQHANYVDDKLIHHHIDQGRFASGLPETAHQRLFPELHGRTTN